MSLGKYFVTTGTSTSGTSGAAIMEIADPSPDYDYVWVDYDSAPKVDWEEVWERAVEDGYIFPPPPKPFEDGSPSDEDIAEAIDKMMRGDENF